MVSSGKNRQRKAGARARGRAQASGKRDGRERPPSMQEAFVFRCVDVLDRIQKKDTYSIFLKPVDPNDAPQYDIIITSPMDLTTVRDRVHAGHYPTVDAFHSDLKLIWSNCLTYNGEEPTNIYSKKAIELRRLTERLIVAAKEGLGADREDLEKWKERHRRKGQPALSPSSSRPPGLDSVVAGAAILGPNAAAASGSQGQPSKDAAAGGLTLEEFRLSVRRDALREQYGTNGLYRTPPPGALDERIHIGPDVEDFRPASVRYNPSARDVERADPRQPDVILKRKVEMKTSHHRLLDSKPRRNPCGPNPSAASVLVSDYVQSLRAYVVGAGEMATRIIEELLSPELAVLRDEEERKKRKRSSEEGTSSGGAREAGRGKQDLDTPSKFAKIGAGMRSPTSGNSTAEGPRVAKRGIAALLPAVSKRIPELEGEDGIESLVGKKVADEVRRVPLSAVDFSMPYGLSIAEMHTLDQFVSLWQSRNPPVNLDFIHELRTLTDQHYHRFASNFAGNVPQAGLFAQKPGHPNQASGVAQQQIPSQTSRPAVAFQPAQSRMHGTPSRPSGPPGAALSVPPAPGQMAVPPAGAMPKNAQPGQFSMPLAAGMPTAGMPAAGVSAAGVPAAGVGTAQASSTRIGANAPENRPPLDRTRTPLTNAQAAALGVSANGLREMPMTKHANDAMALKNAKRNSAIQQSIGPAPGRPLGPALQTPGTVPAQRNGVSVPPTAPSAISQGVANVQHLPANGPRSCKGCGGPAQAGLNYVGVPHEFCNNCAVSYAKYGTLGPPGQWSMVNRVAQQRAQSVGADVNKLPNGVSTPKRVPNNRPQQQARVHLPMRPPHGRSPTSAGAAQVPGGQMRTQHEAGMKLPERSTSLPLGSGAAHPNARENLNTPAPNANAASGAAPNPQHVSAALLGKDGPFGSVGGLAHTGAVDSLLKQSIAAPWSQQKVDDKALTGPDAPFDYNFPPDAPFQPAGIGSNSSPHIPMPIPGPKPGGQATFGHAAGGSERSREIAGNDGVVQGTRPSGAAPDDATAVLARAAQPGGVLGLRRHQGTAAQGPSAANGVAENNDSRFAPSALDRTGLAHGGRPGMGSGPAGEAEQAVLGRDSDEGVGGVRLYGNPETRALNVQTEGQLSNPPLATNRSSPTPNRQDLPLRPDDQVGALLADPGLIGMPGAFATHPGASLHFGSNTGPDLGQQVSAGLAAMNSEGDAGAFGTHRHSGGRASPLHEGAGAASPRLGAHPESRGFDATLDPISGFPGTRSGIQWEAYKPRLDDAGAAQAAAPMLSSEQSGEGLGGHGPTGSAPPGLASSEDFMRVVSGGGLPTTKPF